MSKYTTQVRFICETAAGLTESVGYNDVESVIQKARPKIFDFAYPIFDPAYRIVLETKILKHFYTREIGAETVGLWKLWLNRRLNEIIPYYNELYKSALLEFNPLYDVDLTTDHLKDGSGTNDNKADSSADDWRYYSDTPQGGISDLETLTYLTEAERLKNTGSTASAGTYTDTESYLEHVKGKSGGASFSQLLKEYRETFINIDLLVINELNDLFLNLW